MTYNSALLAGVSAFSSACAEILTASRPTLSRLPCGQYVVWNKDIVIFLIYLTPADLRWHHDIYDLVFSQVSCHHLLVWRTASLQLNRMGWRGNAGFELGPTGTCHVVLKKITKCRPFCSHVSEENNSRISFQGYAGPKIVFAFRGRRFPKQPGKCKGETFIIGNSKS